MWVNILTKDDSKQYMLLTDEEIGNDDTYVLDKLKADGWKEFCNYHRHHVSPQGHKFSVAITDGNTIVGVAIAGRPVSWYRDDGTTLEDYSSVRQRRL